MEFRSIPILTRAHQRTFLRLPWRIYRNDPYWVPPLLVDLRQRLNPAKHAFYEYGTTRLFGVFDEGGNMVGRAVAILNPLYTQRYHDEAGFFGLFECIDNRDAAASLMRAVGQYLADQNCQALIGPANFNTHEESGLLVEGFDQAPRIMCNYCPPYYNELMMACGLEKAMDMISYEWQIDHAYPESFERLVSRVGLKHRLRTRPVDMRRLGRDTPIIQRLYNESFKDVWGFVPMTDHEAQEMSANFKLVADPNLILIAELGNNPVGFILTLPDINQVLQHLNGRLLPFGLIKLLALRRRIRDVRVMVLAVLPDYRPLGIAPYLIAQLHQAGRRRGYERGELSVVMEDNLQMRRVLDSLGFRVHKRYRIYRGALADICATPLAPLESTTQSCIET